MGRFWLNLAKCQQPLKIFANFLVCIAVGINLADILYTYKTEKVIVSVTSISGKRQPQISML